MNPFFTSYTYIPFDKITLSDYLPAFQKGIEEEDKEIQAIVNNPKPPTFANTIEAMEYIGQLLSKVRSVFFNLLSAETSDDMEALAQEVSPMLSRHSSDIILNRPLFQRIKAVYEDHLSDNFRRLSTEQATLLQHRYKDFADNGANLTDEQQDILRQLREETSLLSIQFTQNVLAATNAFILHLTDESDLEGMPENIKEMGRHEARQRDLDGYVYTLKGPSYAAFIKYCTKRNLRESIYMASASLAFQPGDNNNTDIVRQIVNKHREIAQLLGFATYADYALSDRMAENTHNVYDLLDRLLQAYMPKAQQDIKEIAGLYYADNQISPSSLSPDDPRLFQPWDYPFYANKLRQQRYDLDPEELRAYLPLQQVKQGIFNLATRLYGITFRPNTQAPLYQIGRAHV